MHSSEIFDDPIDRTLFEIALRIQLPPSKHRLACDRYEAVAKYVEREGSLLSGKIARFYPQGSMAIGATISARGREEEYDIDVVAELLFPRGSDPARVLDTLFVAIRGERDSRYYRMVKRRTRCVTIYYEDGMHLDITPVVLIPDRVERTSELFHDDPDEPAGSAEILAMNAYGFCELFKLSTKDTTKFGKAYATETHAREIRADAELEEVDPQEDPAYKSSDVVALQLIKRFRNIRYIKREGRTPPSILLSKYVSDAGQQSESILEALEHHAKAMLRKLMQADSSGVLVHESNPSCSEDCFTDRWPLNLRNQRQFLEDLSDLVETLDRLRRGNVSVSEIQSDLIELFGETPVKPAIKAAQEQFGAASRVGGTRHSVNRGIVFGGSANSRVARSSTNMGSALPAP